MVAHTSCGRRRWACATRSPPSPPIRAPASFVLPGSSWLYGSGSWSNSSDSHRSRSIVGSTCRRRAPTSRCRVASATCYRSSRPRSLKMRPENASSGACRNRTKGPESTPRSPVRFWSGSLPITVSTSLKKLDSMLDCVGADGRARGLLQYHAATTGRWSGCLLQPQNLPRPTLEVEDLEELVAAVKTGEPGALRRWGREPLEVL